MKTEISTKKPRALDVDGVILGDRHTLARLLRVKRIYDMADAASIAGLCVRYLRHLCHQEKIAHHKLLGRYYMTPAEIAALLTPVKAKIADKK